MARFRLRLTTPDTFSTQEAQGSFYWLTDRASSFTTRLDPSLRALGPVPALNIDLVRIAVAVYAADRSTYRSRRGSDWNQRDLDLEVPVSNAAAWTAVAGHLTSVLDFLTGDRWSLSFNEESAPTPTATADKNRPSRPSESSYSVVAPTPPSVPWCHVRIWPKASATCSSRTSASHPWRRCSERCLERIERLIPGPEQQHLQLRLSRKHAASTARNYPTESSSRSRSLLFLALGLAVAAIHQVAALDTREWLRLAQPAAGT